MPVHFGCSHKPRVCPQKPRVTENRLGNGSVFDVRDGWRRASGILCPDGQGLPTPRRASPRPPGRHPEGHFDAVRRPSWL